MTLRDSLLPVFQDVRQLVEDFGLRTTRVLIRKRVSSRDETGKGVQTDTDVEVLPRPKVEQLEGVTAEGKGIFKITKITPKFTDGGYDPDELVLPQPAGSQVYIVLVGPANRERELRIVDINERKNFSYTLWCEDRK